MTSTGVTNTVVTDIGMTKAGMTGAGRAANRVKPPLPGTSGGILGTAFAREPAARLPIRPSAVSFPHPSTGAAST